VSWRGWLIWAIVIFFLVTFASKNPAGLGHLTHGIFGFIGQVFNAIGIVLANA
jgi:hypothetical protein